MWKPSDSKQSADTDDIQSPTSFATDSPNTPARVAPAPTQNQYSMIGKSIAIKGEITATDPVYIYGCVEGSISVPEHRVTVGKEGRVKADINAREVVVMGDVCGNLTASERIEIRAEGSLMGDLATNRVSIEEGALLQGMMDVRVPSKKEKAVEQKKTVSTSEPTEAAPAAEEQPQSRMWDTVAVPELS